MNTFQQWLHGKHAARAQGPHAHAAADPGVQLMGLLGLVQHGLHNFEWMSDYRNPKLMPASPRVLAATLAALLAGLLLWHLLPANLNGLGLGLAGLAAAHLALLVFGGLGVALFIRQQRARVRQLVLPTIPWRGTEHVLDVGCGSGMMLNSCARQLTTGRAIGVDLWQESVAGSQALLLANARAEGVADRVTCQAMDARELGFPNEHFDVVVSSLALHHIGTRREHREQAVAEMIRVLRPGGHLALVDVGPMLAIAEPVIVQAGLTVTRREQTRFFRALTARKEG